MAHWLLKSEPHKYSIDDMKRDKTTDWDGVRNYQARNLMKDMEKGEEAFFYHSSADVIGIAGTITISKEFYPDPSQFDKKSPYFDPKSDPENPRWFCPQVKFKKKFKNIVTLAEPKEEKKLADMLLLKRGTRLSVQPVSTAQFNHILKMAS